MKNRSSIQSRTRAAPRPRRAPPGAADAARPATPAAVVRVREALQDRGMVERLARNFKALGDPTRSRLILALSITDMCVSDLAGALGASLSATSHQLRILRDLDLVRVRRDGKSQLYALNDSAFGLCSPRICQAWAGTLRRPDPPAPERD